MSVDGKIIHAGDLEGPKFELGSSLPIFPVSGSQKAESRYSASICEFGCSVCAKSDVLAGSEIKLLQ